MSRPAIEPTQALGEAVRLAYEQMLFLQAEPWTDITSGTATSGKVCWSWVKIIEPFAGMVVVVQPADLTRLTARILVGGMGIEVAESDLQDAQCELTNVIAGRTVHLLLGQEAMPSLGIPRFGRGAPDIRQGRWLGRAFRIAEHWSAVFLQCEHLGVGAVGDACLATDGRLAARDAGGPPTASESSIWSRLELIYPNGLPRSTPSTRSSAGPASSARLAAAPPPPATPAAPSPPATADEPTAAWPTIGPSIPGYPARIGNYELLEIIGEGGMGVVVKARQTTLDRIVALKLMRGDLARDERYATRFMREAKMAAALDHPNIVDIYDAARDGEHLYMALRYIDGGDLNVIIKREGPLPEARAVRIFRACLQGLSCIARHGMIHRDIKPANILIDRDGTPRLADLGLARPTAADQDLSVASAPVGTPAFMSPEQARGARDLDIRTDVYSLGLSLYVVLTGECPFLGENAFETVAKVISEHPKDPRDINPAISARLAATVLRAIAKDRDQRYATVQEFDDALAAVEEGQQRLKTSSGTWIGKWFGAREGG
jgi:tRNA A-37 threonylcarbamoyl transferase component Bud32